MQVATASCREDIFRFLPSGHEREGEEEALQGACRAESSPETDGERERERERRKWNRSIW